MPEPRQISELDQLIEKQSKGKLPLTGAEALQLSKLLAAESAMGQTATTPITMATLPVAPVEYVMHRHTSRCLACNSTKQWVNVYAVNHLKPKFGLGGFVRNMTPVAKLEWNVPVREYNAGTQTTVFCDDETCLEMAKEYIATLPTPPAPMTVTKLTTTGAHTSNVVAKPKAKKVFDSTDDLMNL
jgi:hypothetical protein